VRTDISDELALDMKRRGFKYFGPANAYSYLQTTGVVNDHLASCCLREQG
jgi:DNA-3-methyladenine glycosylase I